jgi:hypothetical protein
MASNSIKVVSIEDNLAAARLLQEYLQASLSKQFSLVYVQRLKEALAQLKAMKMLKVISAVSSGRQ